jgi:hypothetical protein
MIRSIRRVAPLLAIFVATSLRAQDARPATPDSAAVTSNTAAVVAPRNVAGPTLDNATAGVRTNRNEPMPVPPKPLPPTRQNEAMMIVGGAGLIVGAIIGDDAGTLIMVGSGVLGLFGLYKYLE